MKYTPKPNKTPTIFIILFLLISTLVFTAFSLEIKGVMSVALKMTAIMFFMTAILVISRYLTFNYTYYANDFEFCITKNNANIRQIICRLYYTDITAIKPYKEAKNTIKTQDRHNYCVSVFAKYSYCLFYEIEEENGVIIIECSPFFANYIEKHFNCDIFTV